MFIMVMEPNIFLKTQNIYYASSHQYPFYPGTGSENERGTGNIFNCPLTAVVTQNIQIYYLKIK